LAGVSLPAEKKTKNPSKPPLFGVEDFKKNGFSVNRGKNAANTAVFVSILTMGERNIRLLKTGSGYPCHPKENDYA